MKNIKATLCMTTCCAILTLTITSRLSADTSQAQYQLPPNAQVIDYLLASVTWYRHLYAEQQVATDPSDLLFLNNDQVIAGEIVKLSFEFAKADASLASARSSLYTAPATPIVSDLIPSDLPHFVDLKTRAD